MVMVSGLECVESSIQLLIDRFLYHPVIFVITAKELDDKEKSAKLEVPWQSNSRSQLITFVLNVALL